MSDHIEEPKMEILCSELIRLVLGYRKAYRKSLDRTLPPPFEYEFDEARVKLEQYRKQIMVN